MLKCLVRCGHIFALYVQLPEYLVEAKWKTPEQKYSVVHIQVVPRALNYAKFKTMLVL